MSDAHFVEPMPCLAARKLPEGEAWHYQLNLARAATQEVDLAGVPTPTHIVLWRNRESATCEFHQPNR